jgi:hypothetical protein
MAYYSVAVRWAYPAWDEKEGAELRVHAKSKSDAIKNARYEMKNRGYLGRLYFTATLLDDLKMSESAESYLDSLGSLNPFL